ncbi:LPS export ABC transporter periplasmic protein LptC [Pseudoruegeria sp. SK021]|uniref:LPS export ABC transporter periplasmic protein LptC n=1 Tax=Pseudoruegeria sp. SK021 TaxID=1933035 RepID=UPI000A256C14|nr:LPS export ABC transporter periplasmic protein LptC [Pseudoruegeria sp. SK021]OSP54691.1 LPS export ABC transporter periplasmic protein LptC [Pseudoruegeria sp. SK021]
MAKYDNTYSRAVNAVKVILPLMALAILATLFLVSEPTPQGEPIRVSDSTLQDLASEQQLGGATYHTVTDKGTKVRLTADMVRPDRDVVKLTRATNLAAQLVTPDGLVYDIRSDNGMIDETAMRTTMSDNVQIETSSGYTITTDAVSITTDLTFLETLSPVTADGPLGTLTANRMEATNSPETGTDARLVFTGGVHLIYRPQTAKE